MKKLAFSVFDSAANMYLQPFFAPTIEFAIRGFTEAVNKQGHQFQKFPADYTLFHVGVFDQETGMFSPVDPVSMGVAVTFLNRIDPNQLEINTDA